MTGHDPWIADAVAICVPVRNEAVLLPALLDALAGQRCELPMTLCMVFDDCIDGSEAILADRAASLPFSVRTGTLTRDAPDAGRARRAVMTLADPVVARCARVALLTTDADSQPAPDWTTAAVRGLREADVVAGRIARDGTHSDPVQDRLELYYDRLFALRRRLDPVPWEAAATHHYTGGANLAFRAGCYAALGGFRSRQSGEDAAIIDQAHRAGLRVRRDAAMLVETSSRRMGRAIGGLADHLRAVAEEGTRGVPVSHPADAAWQYRLHAAARHCFDDLSDAVIGQLARQTGVPVERVCEVARSSANAEAFAMRLVPGSPHGERLVDLADAERELDRLTTVPQEQAA